MTQFLRTVKVVCAIVSAHHISVDAGTLIGCVHGFAAVTCCRIFAGFIDGRSASLKV